MVYVQNKLLQDKLFLEQWIQTNSNFTAILLFLAIIQAGGDVYLLFIYRRINWGTTVTILILVAIVIIGLVSIFGPIRGGDIFCLIQKAKVEATLTSMSLDGLFYLFLGGVANILALIIMVKRYLTKPVFEQTAESTS